MSRRADMVPLAVRYRDFVPKSLSSELGHSLVVFGGAMAPFGSGRNGVWTAIDAKLIRRDGHHAPTPFHHPGDDARRNLNCWPQVAAAAQDASEETRGRCQETDGVSEVTTRRR